MELALFLRQQSFAQSHASLHAVFHALDTCISLLVATCNRASAAKLPSAWTWCKKAANFCLSSSWSCDQTSACGDTVLSAEECKEGAAELLGPNSAVTVLDHKQAPAGCFADETRAYFNNETQAGSEYSFLKQLCRLKNISTLPEAKMESITACGENKTLPVYRIAAADLERVIDMLHSNDIYQFALLLKQGKSRPQKRLELRSTDNSTIGLDIVIAGQLPRGWMDITQPPIETQLTTHVDLQKHSIFVSGGAESTVCFQDLRMSNGKVCHIESSHTIKFRLDACSLCRAHRAEQFRQREEKAARCFTSKQCAAFLRTARQAVQAGDSILIKRVWDLIFAC